MLDRHAPGHPLHLVQRSRIGTLCFRCEEERSDYLTWLQRSARESGCAVHAYVLMANHVHLLLTPAVPGGATRLAGTLASAWRGDGVRALWEPHGIRAVVSRAYFFAAMRYIESNPVRARLAANPRDYPWSSHRANAFGDENALVRPHPYYFGLGRSPAERQSAYRALFCSDAVATRA